MQSGLPWGTRRRSSSTSSTSVYFKVTEADEDVDVDDEVIEFDNAGSNGKTLLRKLSKGVVPLAASLGFAATPSATLAVRIAGAVAGGAIGMAAKKTVLDKIFAEDHDGGGGGKSGRGGGRGSPKLPATVKATLNFLKAGPPLSGMSLKKLEAVAKSHGVASNDLGILFTHVFTEVILQSVSKDGDDFTELSEVIDFANSVGLSTSEIGDGFALAAIRLGQTLEVDERGFFAADYPQEKFLQAAKIFFLGDKMIGSSTGYYGKRLTIALSYFTPEDFKEAISETCTKLFKRCVESVLLNPDSFEPDEIQRLQEFLTTTDSASTLRPATMQNVIMEAFQLSVDNALKGTTSGDGEPSQLLDARVEGADELKKAQKILGWNSMEFDATLSARTMPVFTDAAKHIIGMVVEKPERASELRPILEERVKALNIDIRRARVTLTTLISEQNVQYMNMIDKVYNVSQAIEPAFKIMVSYAQTHEALKELTAGIMGDIEIPVPGLPFADMVRVSMFKMNLKAGDKAAINDKMFSLDENQRAIVMKNLALPKVSTWIAQCISEKNFADDAKSAYKKLLAEYGVTDADWQSTAVDFYYQEVQKVANMRAIPTAIDMQQLAQLREFLGCTDYSTGRVHMELLGDKYIKAVTEAMTPSGVISEDYLDGLERLRQRLGLSVADGQKLFGFAARGRITPVVKDLSEIWKSDTDATKRREKERANRKDKSGDPISSDDNIFGYMEVGAQKDGGGPNVFMREALNLIDFFTENFVKQGIDVAATSNIKNLPVNAVGVVPEEELVGMFKHYLITRLSEADPSLRQRYQASEKVFGLALGLDDESQMKVKESLSYTAYKNMLKQILRYKDAVEPQDLQQFAILKESLGLDQVLADKVYDESSRGAVLEHAASFMRPKDGKVTPEMVTRFRMQVQSLGLDFRKDTGFNDKLVTYLYALEVQSLVESGRENELKDVQEVYDIPEDKAQEIIEASCKRYLSQILNLALRAAKKYDEKESARWMREVVKYSTFISDSVDADGNIFSEADRARLISFYEAELGSEVSNEDKSSISDRLKHLINLSPDYVPPESGIDGLVGGVTQGATENSKWGGTGWGA